MSFAICETKPRLAEGKNDLKEVALAPDDCCKTIERLRYLKNEKKAMQNITDKLKTTLTIYV